MVVTIDAVYDGHVLKPTGHLDFLPDTRLKLTIETLRKPKVKSKVKAKSFFDTALAIEIEGPSDWSERFEDYLYGNN